MRIVQARPCALVRSFPVDSVREPLMATTFPWKARSVCSGSLAVTLTFLLTQGADAMDLAGARPGASAPIVILERSIIQDQGDWQVDYRFRYDGDRHLMLMA